MDAMTLQLLATAAVALLSVAHVRYRANPQIATRWCIAFLIGGVLLMIAKWALLARVSIFLDGLESGERQGHQLGEQSRLYFALSLESALFVTIGALWLDYWRRRTPERRKVGVLVVSLLAWSASCLVYPAVAFGPGASISGVCFAFGRHWSYARLAALVLGVVTLYAFLRAPRKLPRISVLLCLVAAAGYQVFRSPHIRAATAVCAPGASETLPFGNPFPEVLRELPE